MSSPHTTSVEQRRRVAIEHGIAQVRLEGLKPSAPFFEIAERYIQGEITLEEAITLIKQAVQVPS